MQNLRNLINKLGRLYEISRALLIITYTRERIALLKTFRNYLT